MAQSGAFRPRVPTEAPGPNLRVEDLIVEAAWGYYHDGLNQSDLAKRMGVSRASVVNYLAEARARGWVRVSLDSDVFAGNRLAARLRDAFGLQDALVVPLDTVEPDRTADRVIRAAADWLPRLLGPGDRLGVSWGETVFRLAHAVPRHPVENLTVVQLLGSRPAADGFAAEACTSALALNLDAHCINLHVPLLLSDGELCRRLQAEPVVAAQLEAIATCNKTVLACGTCSDTAHIVRAGILAPSDLAAQRARGATGVICGRLIDAEGGAVLSAVEDRMIGVSLEQMRGKEMALLVAAGPERAAPAQAAILGGYATHLATSADIARELLGD